MRNLRADDKRGGQRCGRAAKCAPVRMVRQKRDPLVREEVKVPRSR